MKQRFLDVTRLSKCWLQFLVLNAVLYWKALEVSVCIYSLSIILLSWSGFHLGRLKLRVVLISEGYGLNFSHVKHLEMHGT